MLIQLYSETLVLTNLLRRLLAEGCPIAEVPAKVVSMEASGEIEWAGRQRLPSKWVLVLLSEQVARQKNGKLVIVTGDFNNPVNLDPNDFLYRERLPPPGHNTIVIQSEGLKARRAKAKAATPITPEPTPQQRKTATPTTPEPTPQQRKRSRTGRKRSLPPEQIEEGIRILRRQDKMTVEAARATLRDAGIDGEDGPLYRLIIKPAYGGMSK